LLFKKGEVQQQALDANALVLDVLKLMRSDLANHGVTVTTSLAPDLGSICGDGVQLQQVLLNLVMNACDAMAENEPGQRRLALRTLVAESGLQIEVSDTGRGLPGGAAERVFERYYSTKPNGLGLGLSVCRTILDAHGGTLFAAANPDGGTTFTCTLGGVAA
jgi:signal transduction histidine kinase